MTFLGCLCGACILGAVVAGFCWLYFGHVEE